MSLSADIPQSETALIAQLGERFLLQAQKLAVLEEYKTVCERRIAQLAPGHPMPITEEHLKGPPEERKSECQGEIDELRRELLTVRSEKAALEASLHLQQSTITDEAGKLSALEGFSVSQSNPPWPSFPFECSNCHFPAEKSEIDPSRRPTSALESELVGLRSSFQGSSTAAEVHTLAAANLALQQSLSACKAEAASAQSQKAYFQGLYNSAKQEAGEREARECRASGEVKELRKALQVMWEGAAAAAKDAQQREEQLAEVIQSLERSRFAKELEVLRVKDAHSRAVSEAKALEEEYKHRLHHAGSMLETAKAENRVEVAGLEGELKRVKEALTQSKITAKETEMAKESELKIANLKLKLNENAKKTALRQVEAIKQEIAAGKSAVKSQESELKSTKEALESVSVALKSLQAVVSSAISTDGEASLSDRIAALESTLVDNSKRLSDALSRVQTTLRIPQKGDSPSLTDTILSLWELVPHIESQVSSHFRPPPSPTPDCLLAKDSCESDLFAENQQLQTQVYALKRENESIRCEMKVVEEQLRRTRRELQRKREDFKEIQSIREERHHFEELLQRSSHLVPSSGEKQLVRTAGKGAKQNAERGYTPETQRAVQAEEVRSSLLQSQCRSELLQFRLHQLEAGLGSQPAPPSRCATSLAQRSFPSSGTISPDFRHESRLSVGRQSVKRLAGSYTQR